ncbi:MAG: hypothetical protein WC344_05200 [Bacilli bacterium]|jgi:hypothetical protein
MKTKVPGAEAGIASGVQMPDFSLPAGDYVLEIVSAKSYVSDNSPCQVNAISMVVLDGPDGPDGKSTAGRKYTRRVNILLEEHPSYDAAMVARNVAELKDLCDAAGVDFDEDGYDPEDFSGQKVKVKLNVKQRKDGDGNENNPVVQKTEDGENHLWLEDDGQPVSRKASGPAPRAAASSGTKKASGGPKKSGSSKKR